MSRGLLNKQELERVSLTIREVESFTSGEIRVYVARHCKGNPLAEAAKKFKLLKMNATELHNAVLIYVAPHDRKAAIYGDSGIAKMADEGFWNQALDDLITGCRDGQVVDGICKAIAKVGELIKKKYPALENDKNELGDEVVEE
jgi:uncharacterized membrane protein